jgi:hypothetical protein
MLIRGISKRIACLESIWIIYFYGVSEEEGLNLLCSYV